MKKIVGCLLLSLAVIAVNAQGKFSIKGKLSELKGTAKAILEYRSEGKSFRDSTIVKNGVFKFKGKIAWPETATISLKHDLPKEGKRSSDVLFFYLESSNIKITGKDLIKNATLTGSKANEDNKELSALQKPARVVADAVKADYNSKTAEQRKDTNWINDVKEKMAASSKEYEEVSKKFIDENPDSYIALINFRTNYLAYNFDPAVAEKAFSKFSTRLQQSPAGKKMLEAIETGHNTSVGAIAANFTQQDSTGKAVSLADYKGQYVLVDFWASWCAPCRAENPNLLKAYNKFKEKKFTILGVSLDDKNGRKAWLKAVEKDGLPWMQVSELNGFQSDAAKLYGVEAIPSNFLIDPQGKIIARNLRGEDLDKRLEELIKE